MNPVVFAVGDSVMQGAGPELYATLPALVPGIEVDAAPSRQFRDAAEIVRTRVGTGPPPDFVVVHLGTNGLFSATAMDDLLAAAAPVPAIVFVTVKAPRPWEGDVNAGLARIGAERPERVAVLDWWALATSQPHYLRPDGFHLSVPGATGYAEAIAALIQRMSRPPAPAR